MKGITGFVLGIIATVAVMAIAALTFGPSMMIHEHISPMGLDDTVNKIVENAKSEGWVVAGVKPLDKSIENKGGKASTGRATDRLVRTAPRVQNSEC